MNKEFEEYGFKVVRNMYDVKDHTKQYPDLYDYSTHLKGGREDPQSPGAPSFGNETEMSKVHIKLLTKMEEETGLKLYPTYNYLRIYNFNSVLEKHTDRPACEISLSLNIGYDSDYNWPIWIEDRKWDKHEVILKAGDGLIYLGCECPHWRKPANGNVLTQSQLFCHYVDQDGLSADCIYDRVRPEVI